MTCNPLSLRKIMGQPFKITVIILQPLTVPERFFFLDFLYKPYDLYWKINRSRCVQHKNVKGWWILIFCVILLTCHQIDFELLWNLRRNLKAGVYNAGKPLSNILKLRRNNATKQPVQKNRARRNYLHNNFIYI